MSERLTDEQLDALEKVARGLLEAETQGDDLWLPRIAEWADTVRPQTIAALIAEVRAGRRAAGLVAKWREGCGVRPCFHISCLRDRKHADKLEAALGGEDA